MHTNNERILFEWIINPYRLIPHNAYADSCDDDQIEWELLQNQQLYWPQQ